MAMKGHWYGFSQQKVLLGFSNRNFSVLAWSLTVGGASIGKHVNLLVLHLISLRSYRIVIPSDYEGKGTESEPVPAHTLVQYNISRADDWSPLRLAAVAKNGQKDYLFIQLKFEIPLCSALAGGGSFTQKSLQFSLLVQMPPCGTTMDRTYPVQPALSQTHMSLNFHF